MAAIKNKNIVLILFCALLPIVLLLLSYKIVLLFIELTPAQENVFGYLNGKQELSPAFTELEVSHLEDVKRVMHYDNYLFYLLLLAVTVIIASYRKDKTFLRTLLNYGGKTTVTAMMAIGMLSIFFFNSIFTLFHKLFFPQGNWVFAADSKIIQTFPIDFFMKISRNIFLLALFLGIIFILIGYYLKNVPSNRN